MTIRFSRHSSFPKENTSSTASLVLWKLQVREWAFASVNVSKLKQTQRGTSNNTQVVASGFVGENGVTTARNENGAVLRFYALGRAGANSGFTIIYIADDTDPNSAVDGVQLQIEVTERRSSSQSKPFLTQLKGKTFAINAPDAVCYEMDTTIKFSGPAALSFAKIPLKTNHLVIGSHGGLEEQEHDAEQLKLYSGGKPGWGVETPRITVDNVVDVFSLAKSRMVKGGVIWLGGCNIGMNDKFCIAAAKASGCYIVAPALAISANKVKKGYVDLIDSYVIPKVFEPIEGKLMKLHEFCAMQSALMFEVPV
jgi:hypothetical protein